jgi:hypothetical protein
VVEQLTQRDSSHPNSPCLYSALRARSGLDLAY